METNTTISTMRKSSKLKSEKKKLESRLNETAELITLAEEEEKKIVETLTKKINTITGKENAFCGIILTKEDLHTLINHFIETKEDTARIDYRIYLKDEHGSK